MIRRIPYRLVATTLVSILLILIFVSACNSFPDLFGTDQEFRTPTEARIVAPPQNSQLVVNGTVYFQSEHPGDNIVQVELLINGKLQRSDFPNNGRVLQPWVPDTVGVYNINIRGVDAENNPVTDLPLTIEVIPDNVVAAVGPQPAPTTAPGDAAATEQQAAPSDEIQIEPAPGDSGLDLPQICSFNDAGAPRLNTFSVEPLGDISLEIQPAANSLPDDSSEPRIVVEWEVTNADQVTVVVQDSDGNNLPPSPVNQSAARVFFPVSPGTYTVSISARNEQCSATQVESVTVIEPQATPLPQIQQLPTPLPSPTPTPYYPPPPAAPGVPPGPVQAQLPELRPPVCDAADYVGVYVPAGNSRITISEPDEIPAKTVGGTQVHRAWRLQNTGTCTWGPGYELAFYGGRSMGSGGVAFETFFPNEPPRRNTIISGEQLVAPEGKPNQVAVLELLLNAPVTPGIHQSYWRMRNPQGIYFGPIIGVTLEVVRQCEFGIYGAPVINYFQIGRVGNVFDPVNPVDVIAERVSPVTFDWSISNAQDYDIIITGPTGTIQNIATSSLTDRQTVTFDKVGTYDITLYADNGPCTATANTTVRVVPNDEDYTSFLLEISSTASSADALIAQWRHQDTEVNQTVLYAQRYERTLGESCSYVWDSSSWWVKQECVPEWNDWVPVKGTPLPTEIMSVSGSPESGSISNNTPDLTTQAEAFVGGEAVAQGSGTAVAATVGDTSQGSAQIANVEWALCPTSSSPDKEVGIRYQMQAKINDLNAIPTWSNTVDVRCGSAVTNSSAGPSAADAGISSGQPSLSDFNPDQ